jgi:RNA polymerase sigma-70 factor (ECF subfamily)
VIPSSARGVWQDIERQLRPFVVRRLSNPDDAGDVLQEIYLRIQTGIASLRDTERFGPWVYQVARNALVDHGRSQARHHPAASSASDAGVSGPSTDGEEGEAERELARYMVAFVAALPSPYREAITLTELEGMTQKDAAELLGLSPSGMKSRVQRGRRQLQRLLQACCEIAIDQRGRVMSFEKRMDGQVPESCCAEINDCQCTGAVSRGSE